MNVNLIKKSFTETSIILYGRRSGYHGLVKLTHEINCHIMYMNYLESLLNTNSSAPSSEILILICNFNKHPGNADGAPIVIKTALFDK